MYMTELPGNYTVHFCWEHVDIGSVPPGTIGNASQQLAVCRGEDDARQPRNRHADLPGIASFTGSAKSLAGVCMQSFSLLDLRGLSWDPERGDRMFILTTMLRKQTHCFVHLFPFISGEGPPQPKLGAGKAALPRAHRTSAEKT
jgi:hypothetical protein